MALIDLLPSLVRMSKLYVNAKKVFDSNKNAGDALVEIRKIEKHWSGSSGFPVKTYEPLTAIGVCIGFIDVAKMYIELDAPDDALRCLMDVDDALWESLQKLPQTMQNKSRIDTAFQNIIFARAYMAKAHAQKKDYEICVELLEGAIDMANKMAVHNPSVQFFQDLYDDSILLSYKVYSYLKEKHPNNKSSYVKLFKEAYAIMLKDDPGNSRLEKYLKETENDYQPDGFEWLMDEVFNEQNYKDFLENHNIDPSSLLKVIEYEKELENLNKGLECYLIGEDYERGRNVTQDYKKAVEWYEKAIEYGNTDAEFSLGRCYYQGEGVEQNIPKAIELYRIAAEKDNVEAQSYLGIHLIEEDGVEAAKWLLNAAEQDDMVAQGFLGIMYCNGIGVEQDEVQALNWLREAAAQDDNYSKYEIGAAYEDGIGVDADIKQALKWYKAAALQGYEKAIEKLDSMQGEYASIIDSIPSAEDIVKMGDSYLTGENGMPKDENKALACFMEAAEQGDEIAQYKLFLHHLKEKNKLEAAKLCHRLAKRAFSVGQYWFGRCCDEGYGVEQNVLESVKWFWRAAAGGYADAQYKLAKLYNGYGSYLRYNPLKAKELYQLAANQGHEDAKQALEKDLLIPDNFKPSSL